MFYLAPFLMGGRVSFDRWNSLVEESENDTLAVEWLLGGGISGGVRVMPEVYLNIGFRYGRTFSPRSVITGSYMSFGVGFEVIKSLIPGVKLFSSLTFSFGQAKLIYEEKPPISSKTTIYEYKSTYNPPGFAWEVGLISKAGSYIFIGYEHRPFDRFRETKSRYSFEEGIPQFFNFSGIRIGLGYKWFISES